MSGALTPSPVGPGPVSLGPVRSGSVDRRWWLALVASLLVHLLVISSPGWHVPTLDDLLGADKEHRIDARLAPPPLPVPAPAVASPSPVPTPAPSAAPPKPAPPKPMLRPPGVASAGHLRPDGLPVASAGHLRPDGLPVASAGHLRPDGLPVSPAPTFAPPVATAATAAAGDARVAAVPAARPAASVPLPKRARIRFAVSKGDQGFVVGRSEHVLKLEGNAYTLRAVAETTGLVALFRSANVVQTSEGELTADGLRPRSFKVERGGKVGDQATFDWVAGRVAMNPGASDSTAEPGMQDLLSMFYQLGMLPVSPGGLGLTVATGKKIERFIFALAGEEKISTPLGEKTALRFKTIAAAGGDTTEVWIDLDRRLPLRIRHVDRKGEIFDQVVEEIEVE